MFTSFLQHTNLFPSWLRPLSWGGSKAKVAGEGVVSRPSSIICENLANSFLLINQETSRKFALVSDWDLPQDSTNQRYETKSHFRKGEAPSSIINSLRESTKKPSQPKEKQHAETREYPPRKKEALCPKDFEKRDKTRNFSAQESDRGKEKPSKKSLQRSLEEKGETNSENPSIPNSSQRGKKAKGNSFSTLKIGEIFAFEHSSSRGIFGAFEVYHHAIMLAWNWEGEELDPYSGVFCSLLENIPACPTYILASCTSVSNSNRKIAAIERSAPLSFLAADTSLSLNLDFSAAGLPLLSVFAGGGLFLRGLPRNRGLTHNQKYYSFFDGGLFA